MAILTVALCQWRAAGTDTEANRDRALEACAEAGRRGADVLLLPELWQVGYTPCPPDPDGRRVWQEMAIEAHGPWVGRVAEAARDNGVAVVVTFLERGIRASNAPRNAALLLDRQGQAVLSYAKVHTCDFSMEAATAPGDRFDVAELSTAVGPVTIGLMICFDREFPESCRELMLAGAEVVLVPNACPMSDERVGQLRTRAFENMTAVALANYPAPEHGGRSCAFDAMAFESSGAPRDHTVVIAGEGEEIVMARIDLNALRDYRAHEVHGDAYRKPAAYRRLASSIAPTGTFSRHDARGRTATPGRPQPGAGPVTIRLAAPDPSWAERFARERELLARTLGPAARRIEHIGSTAVPGLAAKPIVDVLVEVDDPADDARHCPALEHAGYQLAVVEAGHRMYRTAGGEVQVHLWPPGDEVRRLLAFRERLRADPSARQRYEEEKRRLSARPWPTVDAYAEAKGPLIREISAGSPVPAERPTSSEIPPSPEGAARVASPTRPH